MQIFATYEYFRILHFQNVLESILKRQTVEMAFSVRFFDTPPSVRCTATAPANTTWCEDADWRCGSASGLCDDNPLVFPDVAGDAPPTRSTRVRCARMPIHTGVHFALADLHLPCVIKKSGTGTVCQCAARAAFIHGLRTAKNKSTATKCGDSPPVFRGAQRAPRSAACCQ